MYKTTKLFIIKSVIEEFSLLPDTKSAKSEIEKSAASVKDQVITFYDNLLKEKEENKEKSEEKLPKALVRGGCRGELLVSFDDNFIRYLKENDTKIPISRDSFLA